MSSVGVVLFAHGSRDARWAEPFERIAERVGAALPNVPVRLGFLERMEPDLPTAVTELVAAGASRVLIVPLFLGQGGHLRDDIPRLVRAVALEHAGIQVELAAVAGEADGVLDALAAYCVEELRAFDPEGTNDRRPD